MLPPTSSSGQRIHRETGQERPTIMDQSCMTDPILCIRDFSCIQRSFSNSEVSSEGSHPQISDRPRAEIKAFLGGDDTWLLDPGFLFEPIPSPEGDSLEHSVPSTPGRQASRTLPGLVFARVSINMFAQNSDRRRERATPLSQAWLQQDIHPFAQTSAPLQRRTRQATVRLPLSGLLTNRTKGLWAQGQYATAP